MGESGTVGRVSAIAMAMLALTAGLWQARAATAGEGADLLRRQGCTECHELATPRFGLLSKILNTRYTPSSLTGAVWNHGPSLLTRAGVPGIDDADADRMLAFFARAGYFDVQGDPKQGARIFQRQNCAKCHQEKERTSAPPVSRWPALLSPVSMFLAMWRHAPLMRAALDENRMMWPSLSGTEIRDLLAYARDLNRAPAENAPDFRLGNPQAGQTLLNSRSCTTCHHGHQTMEGRPGGQSFSTLAGILWNHAPMMMNLPPSLNSNEMEDLLAYLWESRYFDEPGDANEGQKLFEERRCAACHDGFRRAEAYDASTMLAAFWKHRGPVLEKAGSLGIAWPKFAGRDMAHLIAYANSVRRSPLVK